MAAPKKKTAPSNTPKLIGRPTKYTDEWIAAEAIALKKWLEDDKGIFIGTFARERGYGMQRLSEFAEKSEPFSDAMEFAKAWQTEKLLVGALTRAFDPGQVRYTMARICDPIWKNSWDKDDDSKDIPTQVIIHKYVSDTDKPTA